MDTPQTNSAVEIRAIITQFIQVERLQPKLDKLKDDDIEKRDKLLASHQLPVWLANAAHRVTQIQQVTHALKYTHPDAKGSSLFCMGNKAAGNNLVGTHSLSEPIATDVVGNAAALDVYKFLRLPVGNKTLLQLASEASTDLAEALSSDTEQAHAWMKAFANLPAPKGKISSHQLAKQLYWPIGKDQYHLLSPLFPTALINNLYTRIREDRFSEAIKAARDAHRKNLPFEHGYCEYNNFVIQKFGGTKPQNISQLNSERHGENYLLASLPPSWNSPEISPPYKTESIFERWLNRNKKIYRLTTSLRRYLIIKHSQNNMDIRQKRADKVMEIVDEVLQLAAQLKHLPSSWTTHDDCQLNSNECFWLDPYRAEDDQQFKQERSQQDWRKAIQESFALWLNARLRCDQLNMQDPEYNEWHHVFKKELNMLREEL